MTGAPISMTNLIHMSRWVSGIVQGSWTVLVLTFHLGMSQFDSIGFCLASPPWSERSQPAVKYSHLHKRVISYSHSRAVVVGFRLPLDNPNTLQSCGHTSQLVQWPKLMTSESDPISISHFNSPEHVQPINLELGMICVLREQCLSQHCLTLITQISISSSL